MASAGGIAIGVKDVVKAAEADVPDADALASEYTAPSYHYDCFGTAGTAGWTSGDVGTNTGGT